RRGGDRGGFRRDDRPSGGFRRDDRPSGGFRSGGGDRPYGRRDDNRPSGSGSTGSFGGRRDDKPRWKRNG
ncbi:RNA helicase, partial [Streptomyces sp. NPDC053429]